jgi:hypothetical protein
MEDLETELHVYSEADRLHKSTKRSSIVGISLFMTDFLIGELPNPIDKIPVAASLGILALGMTFMGRAAVQEIRCWRYRDQIMAQHVELVEQAMDERHPDNPDID